ncbi:MAG: NAD(P)-dependent oxidoreductase, partial [bacterium]|nr:NAD(P)-dependent oxidoreductase [bacterium]
PFGCPVRVFDPFVKADDLPQGVLGCDLESLLALSDIVSLHLNRPAKEGPLLGACEFAKMKRGSFLVNTARGHFLDETALQEVLAGGHLAGAALDVFAEEPCNGPLTRLSNVLSTPHVATLTRGSRIAMEIRCAQNVVDYFSNKHR